MASFSTFRGQMVIDPRIDVHCDGWHSRVGELVNNGWHFEREYDQCYMSTRFLIRNPSKGMVGFCMVDEQAFGDIYTTNIPWLYFGPETLLLRAEIYKEAYVPNVEFLEVKVGEPMVPPHHLRGIREMDESKWRIYTPNGDDKADEIIVTPEKIPFLLDAIREAQKPTAKDIMRKQRKAAPELTTRAKILSFA